MGGLSGWSAVVGAVLVLLFLKGHVVSDTDRRFIIELKARQSMLDAQLKKMNAQINAYKAAARGAAILPKDTRVTFKTRRGVTRIAEDEKPLGRIIHKLYYGSGGGQCDRFVVVTPEKWIEIDEYGDLIEGTVMDTDPYGQVHWEENCPSKGPRRY